MAGRPPKPTRLKMLRGTYRPDRATGGEICPEPARNITPPAWLSDPAQDEWNERAPILASNGLLTECDLDTLALYCITWVNWRDAEEAIQREGNTTTAQSGYKQVSPYCTIAKNERAELMRLGDKLGLNPGARSRIHVEPRTEEEELLV